MSLGIVLTVLTYMFCPLVLRSVVKFTEFQFDLFPKGVELAFKIRDEETGERHMHFHYFAWGPPHQMAATDCEVDHQWYRWYDVMKNYSWRCELIRDDEAEGQLTVRLFSSPHPSLLLNDIPCTALSQTLTPLLALLPLLSPFSSRLVGQSMNTHTMLTCFRGTTRRLWVQRARLAL